MPSEPHLCVCFQPADPALVVNRPTGAACFVHSMAISSPLDGGDWPPVAATGPTASGIWKIIHYNTQPKPDSGAWRVAKFLPSSAVYLTLWFGKCCSRAPTSLFVHVFSVHSLPELSTQS